MPPTRAEMVTQLPDLMPSVTSIDTAHAATARGSTYGGKDASVACVHGKDMANADRSWLRVPKLPFGIGGAGSPE